MTQVITVTRRNGDTHEVIVDKDIIIPSRVWLGNGYAYIRVGNKEVKLHRYVMDAPQDKQVDHINKNRLDNRRENLRLCNNQQNNANRIAKGYRQHRNTGRYQAYIKANGKQKSLGIYDTKEEARDVYKKEHAKLFGEFSPYHKEMTNQ